MPNNISVTAPVVALGVNRALQVDESIRISASCRVFLPHSAVTAVVNGKEVECWLDGCVILDDRALLNSEDLAGELTKHQAWPDFAEYWGHNVRCSGAAFIFDEKLGTVSILPDPLGGCSIFHYKSLEISLFSTDLKSLVDVANMLGIVLEKSILFQIERMSLGVGDLSGSPYRDTRIVQQFHYLHISSGGVVEKRYDSYEIFVDDRMTYADLFLRARVEILSNLKALSRISHGRKVAHITGGFDSRLVAAGLVELGMADEFEFFCSGPDGTADRLVADGISASLHLKRTLNSGLYAQTTHSTEDRFLLPMIESAGVSMTGPTGREQEVDVTVLGGGFGELLRSFYSRLAPDYSPEWKPHRLVESLYGTHVFDQGRLLRGKAATELTGRIHDRFKSLSDEGLPSDFLGDAFYSRSRNRLHIGQNAMLWSRYGHRFDPLYSISGFALARKLPVAARDSNVIGFDLMESFQGNLASFPFDRERRSDLYKNMRRSAVERSFSSTSPRFSGSSWPVRENVKTAASAVQVDPELRRKNVQRANALGVNFWQINDLSVTQASVASLLERLDWVEFDDFLDEKYVRHISTTDLRKRHEIRDVYSVYSTLLWYVQG